MSVASIKSNTTIEEYLAAERASEIKHELIDVQIFAMAGASINHDRITGNIFGEFRNHLKQSDYDVLSSDMNVNPQTISFTPM